MPPIPDQCSQFLMTSASDLRSGKTHRDENFPVASWIIHPRHRALILASTISSGPPTISPITRRSARDESSRYLDLLEAELLGKGDSQKEAVNLRHALAERGDAAAPCARCADRVPDGRHQAALRELGRRHPLLPLFGDAGRPLHARRPWREHLDLGRVRCAVRRPADQQPSAGLRQGLSRSQPRLPAARRAGRQRRHRSRCSARRSRRRRCCNACRRWRCAPKRCSTKASRSAPR